MISIYQKEDALQTLFLKTQKNNDPDKIVIFLVYE